MQIMQSKIFKKLLWLMLVALAFFVIFQIYLRLSNQAYIYDAKDCPSVEYAVVFGTSPFTRAGEANQHYWGRINLAAKLYKEGKVKTLIVSGDNQHRSYNEPEAMRKSLLELGVLDMDMLIDPLGLSTIETIQRSKRFYDKNQQIVLITQNYHLPRALLLARSFDINAIGCKAREPEGFSYWFVYTRELLARVKAVLQIVFG